MLVIVRRLFVSVIVFLAILATGRRVDAQSSDFSLPAAAPQISGPIVESNLERLTGNPSPSAETTDLGRVANDFPQEHILMMLRRGAAQQQALDHFMQQQYDPHSANFHKWLTPEQFGSLFGPSTKDIELVTGWLTQQGFTVNHVPAGRTFIDFSGTAGQDRKSVV